MAETAVNPPYPFRLGIACALSALSAISTGLAAPAGAIGPNPPCGDGTTWPSFPPIGAPPNIMAWEGTYLRKMAWKAPACTGWASSPSGATVALAGTFPFKGGVELLLGRIGSISSLKEIRYWSTTDKAWRPLALDAAALSGADPQARRPDFEASEFVPGGVLYYRAWDSRLGPTVYRLRVLERQPSRLVLASENASPVRFLFLTLFPAGALQAVEFLDRADDGSWRVYLMARTTTRIPLTLQGQEASSVNRLVALYRRLADIPTDREPPAWP